MIMHKEKFMFLSIFLTSEKLECVDKLIDMLLYENKVHKTQFSSEYNLKKLMIA